MWPEEIAGKPHALFLGRGPDYPIAMEGALKLKEISYIHAEAYAAGELKHGPLALVDDSLPVIVTASSNRLLSKLVSNMQEVRARGGMLYVFADRGVTLEPHANVRVSECRLRIRSSLRFCRYCPYSSLPTTSASSKAPTSTNPANLAKSVTVE